MITIKKGLDLPISGTPEQQIHDGPAIDTVALIGPDYIEMRPTMLVAEGDPVKLGQPLFSDKKNPGVVFTAPASGSVEVINRGAKRALLSVVIRVAGDGQVQFEGHAPGALDGLAPESVEHQLLASGLWTAFKTRPFSRIPPLGARPHALFVAAMDSNPLAADPVTVIADRRDDFVNGLRVLAHLPETKLHVCKTTGSEVPVPSLRQIQVTEFSGPHPAGLVGTHIHFLHPVGKTRSVWHIGYQDVIEIGHLFTTGSLDPSRVVSLAGPMIKRPRLLRTRRGASTEDLARGEMETGEHRIISGSVFSGFIAAGPKAYLGRYHTQLSVLREERERELLGWITPGRDRFSVTRAYTAHFHPEQRLPFTTSTRGSPRAMVPIGTYELVMPLDILATPLLRALITMDTDLAQDLGCLELDEEDLALCTFVCPGKYEYGAILRDNLSKIEKEG
jgi:Na+-transporting NADH:ubiquinone oxidoreductase subunit A